MRPRAYSKDRELKIKTTWIVFGDDWGVHPSTTQHLILNMPADNNAIWIDSIGMRSPRINWVDFRRVLSKGSALFDTRASATNRLYRGSVGDVTRIKPHVLPLHHLPAAVKYNKHWLNKKISAALGNGHSDNRILLTANPVVAYYSDALRFDKLVYLRLDDYNEYPGCDPALVADAETKIYAQADLVVATARTLLPGAPFANKGRYLPQGVQTDAFLGVPVEPSREPVLGFFGSIAPWLDFDLIESVAERAPDWTLEFIGKPDYVPASMRKFDNVKILPAVPFDGLWRRISHWTAAWIPFKINELTVGVNPLKVREYLAAGLPTHCTPLPEVTDLASQIFVTSDAEQLVAWLRQSLRGDSAELRMKRRASVANESWNARANTLLAMVNSHS